MKNKLVLGLIAFLALSFVLVGCDNGNGDNTVKTTILDGTWSSTSPNRSFKITGKNWVYTETQEYSKGTWSSSVIPSVNSTGTITLTVTQINMGGWQNLPPEYSSVKTNTANFSINAAGNQMIINNAALTTAGVWGTLEGTYTK